MSRVTLEPIHNAELRNQVFDFTSRCAVGETLTTIVLTAAVYSGTDAAPSSIFSGGATVTGQKVTQLIGGATAVAGAVYCITIKAFTSLNQQLKLVAYLPVLPATQ